MDRVVTLGRTPSQPDSVSATVAFCEGRLAPNSIYAVLHRECRNLFPDGMFADLFMETGRHMPPGDHQSLLQSVLRAAPA
jgi:hypothetical protein